MTYNGTASCTDSYVQDEGVVIINPVENTVGSFSQFNVSCTYLVQCKREAVVMSLFSTITENTCFIYA